MVSVRNLSHYIVDMCTRDKKPVSNLQLQKMLYFIQTVYCRNTNGKLLFDECFEAWPYGPVVSSIYEEYASFGGRVIEKTYDAASLSLDVDDSTITFIKEGSKQLREMYPWDLVRISHSPLSPWTKTYNNGAGYKKRIPNDLIIQFATRN